MSSVKIGFNKRAFLYIGFLAILIALPIFISIISTRTQYRGRAFTNNSNCVPTQSATACPNPVPTRPNCFIQDPTPGVGCQCGTYVCTGTPPPTPTAGLPVAADTTTPAQTGVPTPTTPDLTPAATTTPLPTSPVACTLPSAVTNVTFNCPSCSNNSNPTPTESANSPTNTPVPSGSNFISNPSFESGKDAWGFRDHGTSSSNFSIQSSGANSTNYSAQIFVAEASPNTYNVQLYQTFAHIPPAGNYTLTFYAKADTSPWTISICIQDSSGTNSNSTGCQNVTLQNNSSSWQKFTRTFNYKGDSEIDFNVGAIKGNVWLDEISFE